MALFKRKVKLEEFCEYTFRRSLGPKENHDFYKNMFKSKESFEKNFKEVESFIQSTSTFLFISHILFSFKTGEFREPIDSLGKRIVDSVEKIYNEFGYDERPNHYNFQSDFLEDIDAAFMCVASNNDIKSLSNTLCDYIIEKYEDKYDELDFSVGYFVNFESAVVIKTMINNLSKLKLVN